MATIDIDSVNPLKKRKDYDKARETAVAQLLDKTTKPTRGNVASAAPDRHSAKFRRNVISVLGFICVVAGGLSAVHQFTSSDSVFAPFFFGPFRDILRIVAILASWTLGESGALMFSVAAGVIAQAKIEKVVFRGFSIVCAAIAIAGNISSAQLHASEVPRDYFIFSWLLTVVPPLLFLGCGYVLERLFLNDRERSFANEAAYQTAIDKYNQWRDNIDQTPKFRRLLGNEIIIALRNSSVNNLEAIDALDAEYGDEALTELQLREIRRWDRGLLGEGDGNPMPALEASVQPTQKPQVGLAQFTAKSEVQKL